MTALRRLVRFLRLADREAESAHRLSAAQLYVLHSLAAAPADSVAELAGRTMTDPSSVSTVVAKLVARKLVARARAEADHRRFELRLTAAGEKVVRATPRIVQVRISDAIEQMTRSRRRELARSLEGLVRAIGADSLEPRLLFEEETPPSRRRA